MCVLGCEYITDLVSLYYKQWWDIEELQYVVGSVNGGLCFRMWQYNSAFTYTNTDEQLTKS